MNFTLFRSRWEPAQHREYPDGGEPLGENLDDETPWVATVGEPYLVRVEIEPWPVAAALSLRLGRVEAGVGPWSEAEGPTLPEDRGDEGCDPIVATTPLRGPDRRPAVRRRHAPWPHARAAPAWDRP